jgi:hypothetical protein
MAPEVSAVDVVRQHATHLPGHKSFIDHNACEHRFRRKGAVWAENGGNWHQSGVLGRKIGNGAVRFVA